MSSVLSCLSTAFISKRLQIFRWSIVIYVNPNTCLVLFFINPKMMKDKDNLPGIWTWNLQDYNQILNVINNIIRIRKLIKRMQNAKTKMDSDFIAYNFQSNHMPSSYRKLHSGEQLTFWTDSSWDINFTSLVQTWLNYKITSMHAVQYKQNYHQKFH